MKILTKVTIPLLVIVILFGSCKKEDEIEIQKDKIQERFSENFIKCFEQFMGPVRNYVYDFKHDIQDGKVLNSYKSYKQYGEFGKNQFIYNHITNSDGIK